MKPGVSVFTSVTRTYFPERRCASLTTGPSRTIRWLSKLTTRVGLLPARRWKSICGSPSATGTRSARRAPIRSARARANTPGVLPRIRWTRAARDKMDAAFEFFTKLGVPYYCFHDFDMAPEGGSVAESEKNLQALVASRERAPAGDGHEVALGHGEPVLASALHERRVDEPELRRCGSPTRRAQVKAAIDATVELGGENYVFWGGREGLRDACRTRIRVASSNISHAS